MLMSKISKEQREYYRTLDNRLVDAVCDCCGNRYKLKYRQARDYLHKGNIFICPDCKSKNEKPVQNEAIHDQILKERELCIKEMNESKELIRQEGLKKRNKTLASRSEEEKQARKEKIQRTWAAKEIDPEKQKIRSERKKQWWANKSEEELAVLKKSMSDAQKKIFANMTDEDREKRSEAGRKSAVTRWGSLTEEEIKIEKEKISEKSKEVWANRSPEKRKEIKDSIAKGRKKYWDNISPEEMEKISEKKKEWWNNLSQEEFEKQCLKYAIDFNNNPMVHISDNITEIDFINQLNILSIDCIPQYYNITKDPSFNEHFPENIKSGSNKVNPYHKWDFLVKTKTKTVFVDIDGSIHNTNGYDSIVETSTIFYDSHRPYQTDGMDAYAVSCPDDKLTINSEVTNLLTGEKFPLSSLLAILSFYNIDDKMQNKIANK